MADKRDCNCGTGRYCGKHRRYGLDEKALAWLCDGGRPPRCLTVVVKPKYKWKTE